MEHVWKLIRINSKPIQKVNNRKKDNLNQGIIVNLIKKLIKEVMLIDVLMFSVKMDLCALGVHVFHFLFLFKLKHVF